MIKIFGVLKSILLLVGISDHNNQNVKLDIARNVFVSLIFGSWTACTITGTFVSNDVMVIVECFIFSMNCFIPLVLYTYMLFFKSKLFNLIDKLEITLNERKTHFLFF